MKQRQKALTRYMTGLGAAALAMSGFAQGIDGGALLRQQQPLTDRPVLPGAPKVVEPNTTEKPREVSGKAIPVKEYRLSTPLTVFSDEEVNELLSAFRGRNVTFAEIQQAAELVGKQIRDKGYVVTRAYIPAQEIHDGVVMIVVISGRLARDSEGQAEILLKTSPSLRLSPAFAKAVIDNAIPNDGPVKLEQIERGMLLLNELPGIQGTSTIIPGSAPGTVGLALQLSEGIAVQGGVSVDNYGARTTGEIRAGASVDVNDMNGKGDALGLQVVSSDGMKIFRSSYTTPLGTDGLKATIAGSVLTYKEGKELSALDFHGSSSGLSLGLSYPVVLTRDRALSAMVQVETRKIIDFAIGSEISHKQAKIITAGLQQNLLLKAWSAASSFGAYLTAGELDKGHVDADLQQDLATQQTNGHYAVVRLNGSYVQNLRHRFSLQANLTGQTSNKNLDSSEKFYLGGPRGVRAYSIEEAGGDDGGLLSVEGRWKVPRWSGDTDLAVISFVDVGRIRRNHALWSGWNSSNPDMPNTYTLKGMGIGVSLTMQQRGKIELLYARKIGSNPGRTVTGLDSNGRRDRGRIWLTASLLFL